MRLALGQSHETTYRGAYGAKLGPDPGMEAWPFSCKHCLYWEDLKLCIDPAIGAREALFGKRLAWVGRVRKEWGGCGSFSKEPVGYVQYAPRSSLGQPDTWPGR